MRISWYASIWSARLEGRTRGDCDSGRSTARRDDEVGHAVEERFGSSIPDVTTRHTQSVEDQVRRLSPACAGAPPCIARYRAVTSCDQHERRRGANASK